MGMNFKTKLIAGAAALALSIGALGATVATAATCLLYTSPSPRDS